MNAWHNGYILTNPNVIAHNGISLQRQFIFQRSNGTSPVAANDVKRIGCYAIHPMVGSIHDKLHTLGNSAEFANNKPVTYEVIEMSDMLLELVSTIHIIVIGVVTDDNTWVLHHFLMKQRLGIFGFGKASFGFGLFFISINTDLSDNLCFLKVVEIFPKILLFGSAEAVCGQFL